MAEAGSNQDPRKASKKVTSLLYDDFEGKALPELRQRTKVNLRTLFVQVFDYPESPESQLLFFKERYLAPDYPGADRMRQFSSKLRLLGISGHPLSIGPTKNAYVKIREARGLNSSLNRRR